MADDECGDVTTTTSDSMNEGTLTSSLNACLEQMSSSSNNNSIVESLTHLQQRVSSLSLFSSNETLQDVPTCHLCLLSIEHHLGLALLNHHCSSSSGQRQINVKRAVDLWFGFLRTLDQMNGLNDELVKEYHLLLDMNDNDNDDDATTDSRTPLHTTLGESREAKISRFKRKKAAEEELTKLKALSDRRKRMGLDPEVEMDGHDDEGMQRMLHIANLNRCAVEAMEEIHAARRELTMLNIAVQMEQQRDHTDKYSGKNSNSSNVPPRNHSHNNSNNNSRAPPPMRVTKVTLDPNNTGKLLFQKQEIQSTIFRPSWNQPTMSLDELAEKEVADAKRRSVNQKLAEEQSKFAPRRYDQLVRDGMEDHADLMEQSAELDRKWDDFKEANPRGSGNKMTDRGDRNF